MSKHSASPRLISPSNFLALSHVWSGPAVFKTTSANCDNLSSPGSLSNLKQRISKVVQDAINFTRALQERFDSLCIVQDDFAQKHNQIAYVDRIYRSATMSFVALSAKTANDGLPGVSPDSRPDWRSVSYPRFGKNAENPILISPPKLVDLLASPVYDTRA